MNQSGLFLVRILVVLLLVLVQHVGAETPLARCQAQLYDRDQELRDLRTSERPTMVSTTTTTASTIQLVSTTSAPPTTTTTPCPTISCPKIDLKTDCPVASYDFLTSIANVVGDWFMKLSSAAKIEAVRERLEEVSELRKKIREHDQKIQSMSNELAKCSQPTVFRLPKTCQRELQLCTDSCLKYAQTEGLGGRIKLQRDHLQADEPKGLPITSCQACESELKSTAHLLNICNHNNTSKDNKITNLEGKLKLCETKVETQDEVHESRERLCERQRDDARGERDIAQGQAQQCEELVEHLQEVDTNRTLAHQTCLDTILVCSNRVTDVSHDNTKLKERIANHANLSHTNAELNERNDALLKNCPGRGFKDEHLGQPEALLDLLWENPYITTILVVVCVFAIIGFIYSLSWSCKKCYACLRKKMADCQCCCNCDCVGNDDEEENQGPILEQVQVAVPPAQNENPAQVAPLAQENFELAPVQPALGA